METEQNQDLKTILYQKVDELVSLYATNDQMLTRLHSHIVSMMENHERRLEKNNLLETYTDTFLQVFLTKNAYFYLNQNDTYYSYDGQSYNAISENNVNYAILSSISSDKVLIQWKHKTKRNVIRHIKDRYLFKSIPESYTIQNIISQLYPSFLQTKEEVKYFLTIIGDNILKKYAEEESLYVLLISEKTKAKKILIDLDSVVYSVTGINNITATIVTKYHTTYNFDNCRVLKIANHFDFSKINIIDFLCVCAYFSERYQNAENYILTSTSELFREKTLYLKGKTNKDIFEEFCDKCIEVGTEKSTVPWKNVHYIWKIFLNQQNIPNVLYSNTLKEYLRIKYEYCEHNDSFQNITSKWLPNISLFLNFWETTVKVDTNSELEIEEIVVLFKIFASANESTASSANEEEVLKLLHHYYNQLDIFEKKVICNVACSLWDKNSEILQVLQQFKEMCLKKKIKTSLITFDSIYSFYVKQKHHHKLCISKRYFEKFIDENMEDHIVIEKCINSSWLDDA
jgi:hypothetical protein